MIINGTRIAIPLLVIRGYCLRTGNENLYFTTRCGNKVQIYIILSIGTNVYV